MNVAKKPKHANDEPFQHNPAVAAETHGSLSASESQTPSSPPGAVDDELRFLTAPQANDELGRLGGYRILRVLGQGGMGMVLEAEDVGLNRRIALKVMRPEIAHRLANRQRFVREAKAAAAIEHINIVPIYHVGEENDVPFISMPFLKGESLESRLKGLRLDVREILSIGLQIAAGLAAAHKCGLIHRDIKPANIWLEDVDDETNDALPAKRVKILDFGLARFMDDEVKLTGSGAMIGTPAYMPPEQAVGGVVDARADLFSFGAVLYEMATGRLPFQGKTFSAIIISLANDAPTEPIRINGKLPITLSHLIMHLLVKDPAQRPASAKAVADPLRKLLQEYAAHGATSPHASPLSRPDTDATPADDAPARSRERPDSATHVVSWRSGHQVSAHKRNRARFFARTAALGFLALAIGCVAVYHLAIKSKKDPISQPEVKLVVDLSQKQELPNALVSVKTESVPGQNEPEPITEIVKNVPLPKQDSPEESVVNLPAPTNALAREFSKAEVTVRKPGEVVDVEIANGVKMKFCWVPAGSATLGSPGTENDRSDSEKEHEFTTTGFWLAKYAVTQEEWEMVMGDNPSYFSKDGGGKDKVAGIDTSRFPVEQVSWENCQNFLEKVNQSAKLPESLGTGKFALPHEDEWEYACRGGKGNKQAFYFGDELNGRKANCNGTNPYGTTTEGSYLDRVAAVGSYEEEAPHPWGLCDMSGNVYQWCANWYDSDEDVRALRGGSGGNDPKDCRSAARVNAVPTFRYGNIGFRLVVLQN